MQASLDGIGGGLLPEDAVMLCRTAWRDIEAVHGYRPMYTITLMVRGLLLWVVTLYGRPDVQAVCLLTVWACVLSLICCGMLTAPAGATSRTTMLRTALNSFCLKEAGAPAVAQNRSGTPPPRIWFHRS